MRRSQQAEGLRPARLAGRDARKCIIIGSRPWKVESALAIVGCVRLVFVGPAPFELINDEKWTILGGVNRTNNGSIQLNPPAPFADKAEELAQVSARIAHEVNNLLAAILTTTDMARSSTDLPPSLRVDLNDIRDAGHRAAAVIKELIVFSESQFVSPAAVTDPFAGPPSVAPRDWNDSEVVLLVEDEPTVRAMVCRALRRVGYVVLEAGNGEEALRVIENHAAPIHLVISDIVMPEMSGTELVELLRGWYPHIRVLFISGDCDGHGQFPKGLVSHTAFLAKPFPIGTLVARARGLLEAAWVD